MMDTRTTMHRGMGRLLLTAVLLALLALPGLAGDAPVLAGHWEGAIQLPGSPLAISVDLAAKGSALSGTVSIPAQGAKGLPLANVAAAGAGVSFDLTGVPGQPRFKGTLAGDKLAGEFTQNGKTFPFALERQAAPALAARDALAGFDEEVAAGMKAFDVPGMSIAIVQGKEVIYAKGFGFRDVEKKLPVTPDTLFAIGSSTKAFTTFVLGTLVDEGKVEWDKPVRTYIPWFKLYDMSATERITPRDLVTHRSGLPRHDLVWYNDIGASRRSLVEKLAYLEPSADLRETFQYNNLMVLTAGYLEEVVTGKTWEEAVRERILTPLGMTRSNFDVAVSQKDADFAEPYRRKDDKVERIPFRPIGNMGPAGSINSSANEMSRWVVANLNGGKYKDAKLAEASTVNELQLAQMVTGQTVNKPEVSPSDYAMGWFVETYRGHRRVQHGGNIDGFSAMVALFPQDGVGIVALTNMDGTPLRELIVRVAADRLLGLEPKPWIAEAAARRSQAEAAEKEGKKKKDMVRVPGTQPSHKLEDYAGDYEFPGYGALKVAVAGGHLEVAYHGITTPLEHWHYDTFNGGKAKDDVFEDTRFSFHTDPRGYVCSVSAPLEPAVKDIVFARLPDARLSDPAYLKRFAGQYELSGRVLTVELKGKALAVLVPGQPVHDLVPALGDEFILKQAKVISLHFVQDEKGTVNAFELRQPNGVFTAKRK